jgi:hypothetical protein
LGLSLFTKREIMMKKITRTLLAAADADWWQDAKK